MLNTSHERISVCRSAHPEFLTPRKCSRLDRNDTITNDTTANEASTPQPSRLAEARRASSKSLSQLFMSLILGLFGRPAFAPLVLSCHGSGLAVVGGATVVG
eukprot:gnl/TRDRNA2_/TRDRNA2_151665_c0_seq5.p1 gnl/TRDRNA2_/TRDRNA2_151665_c0~~gnl/TRDRNA2_/TRDRNA2_151665_c0_seq5.p1  ORF type:complete len:102 (+),score=7.03 gnl/TRDRNA2_/TRDRNA2_151665_c0_seq5:66-371(+)